jgi:hypothetical protein
MDQPGWRRAPFAVSLVGSEALLRTLPLCSPATVVLALADGQLACSCGDGTNRGVWLLAISGELVLVVVPPTPGQDSEALLRQDCAEAFRQRLAGALHWLYWELEQLLAPALPAPEDLGLLPPAVCGNGRSIGSEGPAALPLQPAAGDLLGQLELSDPLHREALSYLQQLQQRLPMMADGNGADASGLDPLSAVVLSPCPQPDRPIAALLQGLVHSGPALRSLLLIRLPSCWCWSCWSRWGERDDRPQRCP